MKPRLLIIEDDQELLEIMSVLLSKDYDIVGAENGLIGLKQALRNPPDLILLDLKMPHMDGYQTCELIRADLEFKDTPIIVVSGFGGENDRTRALELGADDFVAKPFDTAELKIRIKTRIESARLRKQSEKNRSGTISLGPLRLDTSASVAMVNGEIVHFSQLEFKILALLVEAQGALVSRETILEKVWLGEAPSLRVIDPHIVSLRNKLSGTSLEIASIYKKGYSLKIREGTDK